MLEICRTWISIKMCSKWSDLDQVQEDIIRPNAWPGLAHGSHAGLAHGSHSLPKSALAWHVARMLFMGWACLNQIQQNSTKLAINDDLSTKWRSDNIPMKHFPQIRAHWQGSNLNFEQDVFIQLDGREPSSSHRQTQGTVHLTTTIYMSTRDLIVFIHEAISQGE